MFSGFFAFAGGTVVTYFETTVVFSKDARVEHAASIHNRKKLHSLFDDLSVLCEEGLELLVSREGGRMNEPTAMLSLPFLHNVSAPLCTCSRGSFMVSGVCPCT